MLAGRNFNRLTENSELGHFVNMYDCTPRQFIEKYEKEHEIDLKGKFVIAIETTMDDEGMPINIIGAYYPREDQTAKIFYSGHISFIEIKDKENRLVELLSKDDECPPQNYSEWFDYASECHCFNEKYTEDKVHEFIQLYFRVCMNDIDIEIKKEDIIVLEGL